MDDTKNDLPEPMRVRYVERCDARLEAYLRAER